MNILFIDFFLRLFLSGSIPNPLRISLSLAKTVPRVGHCSDKILVSSDSISFPYDDTVFSLSTKTLLTFNLFTKDFS